jgi:hypothetical protein
MNYVPMALSVLRVLGEPIVTDYSKREGVITSIARRPVCDTDTKHAYLVRYSPKVDGVVEKDFYNYTTVYLSKKWGV